MLVVGRPRRRVAGSRAARRLPRAPSSSAGMTPGVHARDHGDLLGRRKRQAALVEVARRTRRCSRAASSVALIRNPPNSVRFQVIVRTSAPCGSNGHAGTRRPLAGGPAQAVQHRAGLLVVAPHEHGRAGAGDRRAQRAELARPRDQLQRARVQVRRGGAGAGGRASPRGDQVPVARAPGPSASSDACGDVEDRVGQRHLGGQRGARLGGAHRRRAGTTSTASSPAGGVEARRLRRRRRSRSRRAARRRRCRGGPRARSASASTSASSSNRWSAASSPATIAAALEPEPARQRDVASGCGTSKPSAGCRRSNAAHAQVARGRAATSRSVTRPRTCPVSRHLDLEVQRRARRRARRSPARGWPRRRARGRAGAGSLTQHRLPRRAAMSGSHGTTRAGVVERGLRGPSGRGR